MTEVTPVARARPVQHGSERAMLESMLDVARPWTDDDLHSNFRIEPGDTPATIVADYVEECERPRRAVADAQLDDAARGEDMEFTLRYALIHMIQETARHCGHLDLLRETTDGAVGM